MNTLSNPLFYYLTLGLATVCPQNQRAADGSEEVRTAK
jgi:hypothetical protein